MLGLDLVELLKEVFKLPWQDSSLVNNVFFCGHTTWGIVHSLDGEGLSRTCLAISEDGAVVALDA